MVLLHSFHCFHFIGYSMSSSYSSHIIVFSSSYLWSCWILSYLEVFYSWRTSFILLVFGLVDIIIRFKDGHMVNTCQTHVCHMLFTCTTVHCCVHSLFYCITYFFSFYLLSLSFNLYSLFILLSTSHSPTYSRSELIGFRVFWVRVLGIWSDSTRTGEWEVWLVLQHFFQIPIRVQSD